MRRGLVDVRRNGRSRSNDSASCLRVSLQPETMMMDGAVLLDLSLRFLPLPPTQLILTTLSTAVTPPPPSILTLQCLTLVKERSLDLFRQAATVVKHARASPRIVSRSNNGTKTIHHARLVAHSHKIYYA